MKKASIAPLALAVAGSAACAPKVNDPADVQAVKDTAPAYDKFANAGDTAVVHGLWTEKSTLNGKDTSGQYRFTDTFIKRDGRWQAVATFSTKLK